MNSLNIRPAILSEAQVLTAIALRSKAHWGYSDEFIELFRDEITVKPAFFKDFIVNCAENNCVIQGFYVLIPKEKGHTELEFMFVDPPFIGMGVGRMLLLHAIQCAKEANYSTMDILSDPYAAPFYEKMGAKIVRDVPSERIPGRSLPLYYLDLNTI